MKSNGNGFGFDDDAAHRVTYQLAQLVDFADAAGCPPEVRKAICDIAVYVGGQLERARWRWTAFQLELIRSKRSRRNAAEKRSHAVAAAEEIAETKASEFRNRVSKALA